MFPPSNQILSSIVVSIPSCHAGDRGSISLRAEIFSLILSCLLSIKTDETKHQLEVKTFLVMKQFKG